MKNFQISLKIDPLAQWLSQKAHDVKIILIISGGFVVEPKKNG